MVYRNLKVSLVLFVILLVGTNFVLAASVGVNSPYYKSNSLKMASGQEKEILFAIHNCPSQTESCDKEDITAEVTLEEGSNIAEIVSGKKYDVNYGSSDNIRLKVSVPADAAIGEEYLVRMSVVSAPSGEGVRMGVKYNVEFPVIVTDASQVPGEYIPVSGEEVGKISLLFLTVIILLIIVILIVVIILYRMLRKNKQI